MGHGKEWGAGERTEEQKWDRRKDLRTDRPTDRLEAEAMKD